MITTTDAMNIIYRDCKVFGIKIYQIGQMPNKEIAKERITIHAKSMKPDTYWNKGFIEVNFSVPDVKGEPNLIRLQELERAAVKHFDSVGEHDSSYYRYSVNSHGIEKDVQMKCHFVNIRLLFEVLNVN